MPATLPSGPPPPLRAAPMLAALLLLALVGGVVAAGPDLQQLGKCSAKCNRNANRCLDASVSDDAAVDKCVFNNLIGCNCDCRRFLSSSSARGASSAASDADVLRVWPRPDAVLQEMSSLPAARDVRISDAANKAITCFNNEYIGMLDCAKPCIPTKNETCATQCIAPAFDRICGCDPNRPADPSTTTVAPSTAAPSTAAPGPTGNPYEEFSKCHLNCQLSYSECSAACADPACADQCLFDHVMDCNCGCKKYLDSSRNLRSFFASLKGQRQLAARPSTALTAHSDAAKQAEKCYVDAMQEMYDCMDMCANESCVVQCSKRAFEKVCGCSPGPSTTVAPPTTLSPLDQLGKCYFRCGKAHHYCVQACTTGAPCIDQCVLDYLVDCNCGCRKYLDASTSLLAFVRSTQQQQQQQQQSALVMKTTVDPDDEDYPATDGDLASDCYQAAVGEMNECVKPCMVSHDEACAIKCVRPAFDKICNCDPRKASTTMAPPSPRPPTSPPMTPSPRPPTPPTTTPKSSAASLRVHFQVLAAACLLALLSRS